MKKTSAFITATLLVGAGFTALPALAADLPTYYPVGPENNVPIQDVLDGGWEICYEGTYDEQAVPLYGAGGILSDLCTGDHLMLAGYHLGESDFAVLAAAPRDDVLQDVGTGQGAYHEANGTRWYFSPDWSWGFVSTAEVPYRIQCDAPFFRPNMSTKTLCWPTDFFAPGYMINGFLLAGEGGLNFDDDVFRVVLQPKTPEPEELELEVSEPRPIVYSGPVVINAPQTASSGSVVTFRGTRLDSVASATIAGLPATIDSKSANLLTLRVPAGLTEARHDVVLHYRSQAVTLHNAFMLRDSVRVWTKRLADGSVKLYAKNVVGAGKVQFFHNGREVAWVRAIDASDPKLISINGATYLVRSILLTEGKNVFEIHIDGKRAWRAAYTK